MKLKKEWVTDFIHHSNGIEGINTSKASILAALCAPEANVHPYIKNQIKCIEWVVKNRKKIPTLKTICELHGILLDNVDRFAGKFRTLEVRVGDHSPPGSHEVTFLLQEWLFLWNYRPYASWSHKKSALFRHYEFEWIHPFTDGNGRVGRLLYLWDCLYHKTKMDIIKSDPQSRKEYYEALRKYQLEKRNELLSKKWVSNRR